MKDDKVSSRDGIGLIALFTCIINSLIVVLHKSTGFDLMTSLIVYCISSPLGIWGLWARTNHTDKITERSSE